MLQAQYASVPYYFFHSFANSCSLSASEKRSNILILTGAHILHNYTVV